MQQDSTTYSISDLAKEFSITPRSIRHYEELKLIFPKRVGSQRIYKKGDKTRLQLILRGKRIGFSLSEIKEIISLYDKPGDGEAKQTAFLLEKIEQRREILIQQKNDVNTMLEELAQLEKRLEQ